MSLAVTLDASVWLAAVSSSEAAHTDCALLLNWLVAHEVALHQPGLFVIEVCATIARRTRDARMAERMGRLAVGLPGVQLHELDHSLGARASRIAARRALRGADAVYVATAQHSGSALITIDRELAERVAAETDVHTPAEWLAKVAS